MKDNIILFNGVTTLPLPADRVLENTPKLQDVVILGYDSEGEFYFSSSIPDGPNINWLMDLAKKRLLETN